MVEILKSEKSMFCDLKSHVELQYIYFILQIPFSKNIYHLIAPNFGLGFAIGKWWYNSNISKNNILSVTFTMIFVYGMYSLVFSYWISLLSCKIFQYTIQYFNWTSLSKIYNTDLICQSENWCIIYTRTTNINSTFLFCSVLSEIIETFIIT